jgi:hypothetical protein
MRSLSLFAGICLFASALHAASVNGVSLGYDPAAPSPDHDLLATYNATFDPMAESGVKVVFDWRRWGQSIAFLNMPFEQSDAGPADRTNDYSTFSNVATVFGANWSSLIGTYDGGGYFDFDGNGDYIRVQPQFTLQNQFTLEARLKPDTINDGYRAIISKGINPRPASLWLDHGNHVQVWWGPGSGTARISSVSTLSPGVWHHVAATYDGTVLRLYINGMPDSSVNLSNTPPANNQYLYFGQRGDNAYYFDGKLDEVRIWRRALSAAQVADFANGGPDSRLSAAETEMSELWTVAVCPNGRIDNQSYEDGQCILAGLMIQSANCDYLLYGCNQSWQSGKRYCLGQDITGVVGTCMKFENQFDVTLHCNGLDPSFDEIEGDYAGPSFDHGIEVGDFNSGPSQITITGCTIRGFAKGIHVDGPQQDPVADLAIIDNDIVDNSSFGVHALGYSNNALLSGNWFRWNGEADTFYDTGTADVLLRKDNSNWTITDNLFDGGFVNANRSGLYLGSYLGANPNVVVSFNRFANYDDGGSAGIELENNTGGQFYNNVFQGNAFGLLVHFSPGNTFWNNDFKFSSAAHAHRHPAAVNNLFTNGQLGNYWDDFDTPADGCHDLSPQDGICDTAYDTGILDGDPDPIVDIAPRTTPVNP